MSTNLANLLYLIPIVAFILALRFLSNPAHARRGNQIGAAGMVVVTPEPVSDVRVGQVISYRIPVGDHHVQSHRVIAVLRRNGTIAVRTKGDANATADPWTATLHGTTVWRVRGVLPKLGWVVFWLRTPLVHRLTLFLAPLLLALLAVLQIWRRPVGHAPEGQDAVGTPSA